MIKRKYEMQELVSNFKCMPDRLGKYVEILLLGEDASPYAYQDTMSYRSLAIAVTTYCNLKCKWCYRFDSQFKGILNKHMTLEVFKKIIRNTRGRFKLIHLAGTGEPLVYPHLIDTVQIAREKTDNVKITTNGTIITPRNIDELVKAGLTHIEFSVDAFSLDKLTDFRGSNLNHIVDIVKYISNETNLILQINSVVASLNYDYLFNIVEVFKEAKNINIIHTISLFITQQLPGLGVERVTDDKYIELLEKIESDIERNNLDWKLQPSSHGVSIDPIIEMKRRRNICFSCFEDPYIDTEGNLVVCGRREFHPVADATVGFEKAMNSPKALEFRSNVLKGNYDRFCDQICYIKRKKQNCNSSK